MRKSTHTARSRTHATVDGRRRTCADDTAAVHVPFHVQPNAWHSLAVQYGHVVDEHVPPLPPESAEHDPVVEVPVQMQWPFALQLLWLAHDGQSSEVHMLPPVSVEHEPVAELPVQVHPPWS